MNGSIRVKVTAYIFMAVYSIAFAIYGITLPSTASRILSFLPTLIVVLFAIFDNWLWHLGPIPKLLKQPDLRGTWHGTLTSYRRDAAGHPIESQHDIFVVVRQSLVSLSVTLISLESKSRSAAAQIIRNQSEDYSVQYQYRNEPKLEFRQAGSSIHTGGATVDAGGTRPHELTGEYWTARETRGTFDLTFVRRQVVNSYSEGQALLLSNEGN